MDLPSEINLFFNTRMDLKVDLDPLLFYKENQFKYKYLSKLARMLFSIPASSVPSESLFSKTGEVTTDRRNRMKPRLIENLMFIQENSKFNNNS